MLSLLLLGIRADPTPSNSPLPAADINITKLNETIVIDYTNTVIFSLTHSPYATTHGTTVDPSLGSLVTDFYVYTLVVSYIPTLFWVQRVMAVTPAPTDFQALPPATQALRIIIFHPGILCGATFALVFLGGGLWTYRCRKPRHVIPPPVRKGSDSDSLESVKKGGSGRGSGSEKGSKKGSHKSKA
jgi:hypothetical protein